VSAPAFKIVVDKGPAAGTEVAIDARALTIGRDESSSVVLSGDEFVAPRHAMITVANGRARLLNLSPNGTLVNGRPASDTPLAAGDRISIGRLHLLSLRERSSPPIDSSPLRPATKPLGKPADLPPPDAPHTGAAAG